MAGESPVVLTETVKVVAWVGVAAPVAGVTENQLAPSLVSFPVANVSCEPVRFDRVMFCDPAEVPPAACVKISPVGRTRGPGLLPAGRTFRITETNWGVSTAVADVTLTCPLYWPGVRLAGFTDTVTNGTVNELASVVPDAGVTDSQALPPVRVELDTDQSMEPLPLLRMPKVCGGTIPPLATAGKVRPVCDSRITCCTALTVTVTGIVWVVSAATVIRPVYVPAAKLVGSTLTVSGSGVESVAPAPSCVTESQLPPELVDAEAL